MATVLRLTGGFGVGWLAADASQATGNYWYLSIILFYIIAVVGFAMDN